MIFPEFKTGGEGRKRRRKEVKVKRRPSVNLQLLVGEERWEVRRLRVEVIWERVRRAEEREGRVWETDLRVWEKVVERPRRGIEMIEV